MGMDARLKQVARRINTFGVAVRETAIGII